MWFLNLEPETKIMRLVWMWLIWIFGAFERCWDFTSAATSSAFPRGAGQGGPDQATVDSRVYHVHPCSGSVWSTTEVGFYLPCFPCLLLLLIWPTTS